VRDVAVDHDASPTDFLLGSGGSRGASFGRHLTSRDLSNRYRHVLKALHRRLSLYRRGAGPLKVVVDDLGQVLGRVARRVLSPLLYGAATRRGSTPLNLDLEKLRLAPGRSAGQMLRDSRVARRLLKSEQCGSCGTGP
jgi:hypothetical protein